jgi:hypothetical protein
MRELRRTAADGTTAQRKGRTAQRATCMNDPIAIVT